MPTERALELTRSNREDARRVRSQVREIDTETANRVRLIGDPAIEEMAKKAISRQMSTLEQDRQRLEAELDRLADDANDNTEEIAEEVRTVMAELKQGLASPDPKELREIISEYVGPIRLLADGKVAQKETPEAIDATGVIAGVGFEPTTSGL